MVANATIDRDDHGVVTGITDGGNANINVTTLQTSDIADSHSNNAVHVGVTATNHTDIRVHQSGHHKEGVHRATIGNGTLNVAHGAPRDPINHDLSAADAEVVVDKQDSGLDVGLTVDHRLITDTGSTVGKGIEGISGCPTTWPNLWENSGKALVNLGAAIHDNATGNGHDGVLSDYRSRLRHQQLALHGKRHAALTQALNNVANNPQELEAQLMLVAKDMAANDLGDGNVNVVVYHANDGAMGGYNNGNIYINLAYRW